MSVSQIEMVGEGVLVLKSLPDLLLFMSVNQIEMVGEGRFSRSFSIASSNVIYVCESD